MPWENISLESLAKKHGVSLSEIREKQKLIDLIIAARKEKHMSQTALAKKMGVSQSRIAQIESAILTHKVTFDLLLSILVEIGFDYKVVARKIK